MRHPTARLSQLSEFFMLHSSIIPKTPRAAIRLHIRHTTRTRITPAGMKEYSLHAQRAWSGVINNAVTPTLARHSQSQKNKGGDATPLHTAWATPLLSVLVEDAVAATGTASAAVAAKMSTGSSGQTGGFIRGGTRPHHAPVSGTPGQPPDRSFQTGGFIRSNTRPPQQPQTAGKRTRMRHTRRTPRHRTRVS